MNIIKNNSLEVLRECKYTQTDIGLVSDNAYLSIVATNNCNKHCFYCINSETDRSIDMPLKKAVKNIGLLKKKYDVKECVILGGEPTLYPDLMCLLSKLKYFDFRRIGMTTNGEKLMHDLPLAVELARSGLSFINISQDNTDHVFELIGLYHALKSVNPGIRIRINTNVYWKNNSTLGSLVKTLEYFSKCADEIRVSNLILKDNFSVNSKNNKSAEDNILGDEEYESLFDSVCEHYAEKYNITIIENEEALGFVKYRLIPTRVPIILNYNINSQVSKQVCENEDRKINTFKCLVTGDISLSWNTNNIIKLV